MPKPPFSLVTLTATVALALFALAGCSSPNITSRGPSCPSVARLRSAQRLGLLVNMSFACAQEYASFPILMPRRLPAGSHLAYVDPVFPPNRPIGSTAHPRTPEVLLDFTKDANHHQLAIAEYAGQQPLADVRTVTFDNRPLLAGIGTGKTPSGVKEPGVQVAAVISGHSYVVSGTIALRTAERVAVSFFK